MFGYVTINKSKLSEEEYGRFHEYYCGLCRTLKRKYGRQGQLFLNYDMTFLTILLTSLYEPETKKVPVHCVPNGLKRHEIAVNTITEYAADMNMALAYHKCRDDWADEHAMVKRAIAGLLHKNYDKIKLDYPRQCQVMEQELLKLAEIEQVRDRQEKEADIDSAAECFGRLTAELFLYREDEWQKCLWQLGFSLGKFIYLMDAYEDLKKDMRKGSYNPLKRLVNRKDFHDFCRELLVMTMADCSKSFEMLPLLCDVDILRNILYSGVWTRYELVQQRKK